MHFEAGVGESIIATGTFGYSRIQTLTPELPELLETVSLVMTPSQPRDQYASMGALFFQNLKPRPFLFGSSSISPSGSVVRY